MLLGRGRGGTIISLQHLGQPLPVPQLAGSRLGEESLPRGQPLEGGMQDWARRRSQQSKGLPWTGLCQQGLQGHGRTGVPAPQGSISTLLGSAQGSNKRKGVIIQGGNWANTGSRCQDSKDTHPKPALKSPQQRSHKWKFACPVISGTSSAPYQQRMSAAGHMEGLLTLECARPACRDRKSMPKPSLTPPLPLVLPPP